MSAGTRVYTVRLSNDIAHIADRYLGERMENPDIRPWTFSTLVRVALVEFFKKTLRSRRKGDSQEKADLDAIKDEVIDLSDLYPPSP
jgi:hypothetical protein